MPIITISITIPSTISVITFITRIHKGFTGSLILLQPDLLRVIDLVLLAITTW